MKRKQDLYENLYPPAILGIYNTDISSGNSNFTYCELRESGLLLFNVMYSAINWTLLLNEVESMQLQMLLIKNSYLQKSIILKES